LGRRGAARHGFVQSLCLARWRRWASQAMFSIKRWSECNSCKLCENTCHWGAIDGPKIIKRECVRCDDCERLYMDQQKCPHWIIIRRKSDLIQREGAGTPGQASA
jgi:MinD superfamily P-loop ATPase